MSVAFISHADCGRHDTGWGHPEHVGRLRAIPRALRYHFDLFEALAHLEGRHATEDELLLAHDAAYVTSVRDLAQRGGGRFDADTVASEGSWDAATAGAGSVLDAVDFAMTGQHLRSFCAVRPPGHHALRASAMGFCLFGNVAIGARYARKVHGAERVLIVDWDVHHGNGTQAIVEDDESILFLSLHQWPFYPGTGGPGDGNETTINIPLAAGSGNDAYLAAFREIVEPALARFAPDLLIVSAGFDAHIDDPLAGMELTGPGFHELARRCAAMAPRVAAVLEGGYNVATLPRLVETTLRGFAEA